MIVTLYQLAKIISASRDKYAVAHCHGVFDVLTVAHVRHFQAAKRLGQRGTTLVVTVTPDTYVGKGEGRPVFKEDLRLEVLNSLRPIDFVALNEWPSAVNTIKLLRPDFYVKGSDYRGKMTEALLAEEEAVKEVGGKLVLTDGVEFHSTELIAKVAQGGA